MSDEEAKGILNAEFLKLRATGYSDLVDLLADKKVESEVTGLSGEVYHVSSRRIGMTTATPICVSSRPLTMAVCGCCCRLPTRSRSAPRA